MNNINRHIWLGNLKKFRRGQLKIQQTAFMLVAVTLFFALVGIFILAIQLSNIKESSLLIEEKESLILTSTLANSPEFSCGDAFGTSKINCIDKDKVMALKNNIQKYSGFWGVEGIEIREIYPGKETIKIIESESGIKTSNFVAICSKEVDGLPYNNCSLGQIMITYKNK